MMKSVVVVSIGFALKPSHLANCRIKILVITLYNQTTSSVDNILPTSVDFMSVRCSSPTAASVDSVY